MNKVIGCSGVSLLECVNPKKDKWRVRWNIVESEDGTTAEYMEEEFAHKPTLEEIRKVIIGWHNAQIDEKILSGFEWNGMSVWLSAENQKNYESAFYAAAMAGGSMLPVTFKFGSDLEPQYHEFATIEELSDFYFKALTYIQTVLSEGWKTKDCIDFRAYASILGLE